MQQMRTPFIRNESSQKKFHTLFWNNRREIQAHSCSLKQHLFHVKHYGQIHTKYYILLEAKTQNIYD